MSIHAVWEAIPESEWATPDKIRKTSGLDEDRLNRILNFLIHWKFAETRNDPELHIRRRHGAMSPENVIGILQTMVNEDTVVRQPRTPTNLAERVACQACGGHGFNFIEQNLVECTQCRERQWYAIEFRVPHRIQEKMIPIQQRSRLRRFLSR
jgi:hypothetical protein